MQFPPGQAIKSAIDLATLDFFALLGELGKKKFTGYLAVTVKGTGGIEEGTLVFSEGKAMACTYEYFRYGKLLLGSDAFPRIVNASAAKKGVVDIVQISPDQVKLVIAFNEKMVFVPSEADLANVNVTEFSPYFEEQVKETAKPDRAGLLKKLKLGETESQGEAARPERARQGDADKDDDMLEELVKG